MKKNNLKIVIIFGSLFFLVAVLFLNIGNRNDKLIVADFEITKGENVWKISRNLKNDNLIDSRLVFSFHIYKEGLQNKIKAGKYKLNSGLSSQEIVDMLIMGVVVEDDASVKLTFPEGWSSKQMAVRLESNGFSGEEFLKIIENPNLFSDKYSFLKEIPNEKNLEGYLFPDTYFFDAKLESENDIIEKMLENFDKKITNDLRGNIKKQGKTIYEIVTMASILEREVRTQEDRKIVSGIFWNRLDSGQAFQSCATLSFILGENKKQYSYDDTRIESPYNTYLYPGLPPGPIVNPGLDAITAAIYPTENNYIYFLNNPETGETVFSKTLEEHNINKVRNGL